MFLPRVMYNYGKCLFMEVQNYVYAFVRQMDNLKKNLLNNFGPLLAGHTRDFVLLDKSYMLNKWDTFFWIIKLFSFLYCVVFK